MRRRVIIALLALIAQNVAFAQKANDDRVIMKINGKPVMRSEFEYSYNKNNSEGVIDKKTVEEYVDLFINYKLKVEAALDAKLDTMKSFNDEFTTYRDQQIVPSFATDEAMLAEAQKVYDNTKQAIGPKGLIMPAHILLRLKQNASKEEENAARTRIDSIYQALLGGADFAEMAKKFSQDPGTAQQGGQLPWIGPGQTVKEFEDAAYALQKGEMSKPVQSAFGFHILLMKDRKQLEPFEELKGDIMKFLEERNARERVAERAIDDMVAKSNGKLTRAQICCSL